MNQFELDDKAIMRMLNTKSFGRKIYVYENTDSTSIEAHRIEDPEKEEGTLLIAVSQNSGRGRFDRKWISPAGGIWFSLILTPQVKNILPLTIIAGASIARSIRENTELDCKFHWPNDLLIGDKKVGGILLESRYKGEKLKYLVAGVGINANFSRAEIGKVDSLHPTTILDEISHPICINGLIADILNNFESDYNYFTKNGSSSLIEKYKSLCATLGRRVRVLEGGGIVDGIAEIMDLTGEGALVALGAKGRIVINNAQRIILLPE